MLFGKYLPMGICQQAALRLFDSPVYLLDFPCDNQMSLKCAFPIKQDQRPAIPMAATMLSVLLFSKARGHL